MTVVSHFNIFDMYQTVALVDETTGEIKVMSSATMGDLGATIAEYCLLEKANHVHLFGDGNYALKLINDIDRSTKGLYSANKIGIEVN